VQEDIDEFLTEQFATFQRLVRALTICKGQTSLKGRTKATSRCPNCLEYGHTTEGLTCEAMLNWPL